MPLLRRAHTLWRELEVASGEAILAETGVLTVGEAEGEIVSGTLRAAAEHDLPLIRLGQDEFKKRYPSTQLWPEEVALLEEDAGVLDPEGAVRAQLKVARSHGAEMQFGVSMTRWTATGNGFEVLLGDGQKIAARALVLSLGPWFKETLESLGVPVRIERNVQVWFGSSTPSYRAPDFPAFLVDRRGLPAPIYGFPDFGHGVKAAFHGGGTDTEVGQLDRAIDPARDVAPLQKCLEQWMPGAAHTFRHASACMYTMSPDAHFVVDRAPNHSNLILCGGFSGHGFKFAPVVGEIGAELALDGGTRHEIEFLSLRRFQNGQQQVT